MYAKSLIEKLENRYDAENDVNPEWPNISWAEYDLVQIVDELLRRIETLESEMLSDCE
jgi:hypothetical protein